MVMRPHTATLFWYTSLTFTSLGVEVPGVLNTIVFNKGSAGKCSIQPTAKGGIIIDQNGDELKFNFQIITNRFTNDNSIPVNAKLQFGGVNHMIVQIFPFSKHVEISCR